jgi:hypothetical protein
LQAQKLSRDFVLQTLSQNLDSDPTLTEALVTDAALLTDPTNPGGSLRNAFLKIGQQGVSATYYTSVDESGAASVSGVNATADTSDPTNSAGGTRSCHFEGYLQVLVDGSYRFFAELKGELLQGDVTSDLVEVRFSRTSKAWIYGRVWTSSRRAWSRIR